MFFRMLTIRRSIIAGIALLCMAACYVTLSRFPSVAELKNRCSDEIDAKDWNAAEKSATQWAAIAPDNGEPWVRLAESLSRQRKYQLAANCLERVPPSSPESAAAALSRMELQFGPLNRPIDAAETCESILAVHPDSTVAQQRLIFFLTFTLQRARLARQIRSAIDTGNEPIEAYVYLFFVDSLAFSNGAELNGRWLRGNPESELFEVGEAIFIAEVLDFSVSLDDYEGAQATRAAASKKSAVMEKLLAKYPHNSELLAYNIRQSIQFGDVASVVKLLAQVTVDAEVDPRFWRFKGWVHAQRHQVTESESAYRRSIGLNPLEWTTRHMLADLFQQERRFEEVKPQRDLATRGNELRRVLRHAPNAKLVEPGILKQLADYSADCGDKQVSDGLRRHIHIESDP